MISFASVVVLVGWLAHMARYLWVEKGRRDERGEDLPGESGEQHLLLSLFYWPGYMAPGRPI
jgi:hypothetical protein